MWLGLRFRISININLLVPQSLQTNVRVAVLLRGLGLVARGCHWVNVNACHFQAHHPEFDAGSDPLESLQVLLLGVPTKNY
jgi:hypothetical protein